MSEQRRSQKADERKALILNAAVQVICARGYDATRFSDVSEASGVPIATLQYYFGAREDLLLAAFRFGSETLYAQLQQRLQSVADPFDKLTCLVDMMLEGYHPDSVQTALFYVEFFRFALHDPDMRLDMLDDYRLWRNEIADAVQAGMTSGQFAPDIDPDRVAIQIVAIADGVSQPVALGDPLLSVETARKVILANFRKILGMDRGSDPTADRVKR